jgi:hypothetical protein
VLIHPTARGVGVFIERISLREMKRDRRGVCPSRVVRNMNEAHASPADRGFGRMARWLGRIPCRIARNLPAVERPESTEPSRHLRLPHAWQPCPLDAPASERPRVLAASPANRIMPSCFRPDGERLPHHPTSTAPTTRHDLASVQRTGGRIARVGGEGIRFFGPPSRLLSTTRRALGWPLTPTLSPEGRGGVVAPPVNSASPLPGEGWGGGSPKTKGARWAPSFISSLRTAA